MAFVNRFSIDIPPTALTGATDLVQISAATTNPVRVHALLLGQTSEVGDAQDEQLSLTWVRGNTVSGSGGASATPVPLINTTGSLTAASTVQVVNTTPASSGTAVNVLRQGWAVRSPIVTQYSGDLVFGTSSSDGLLCLRMSAPADKVTVVGSVLIEELQSPGAAG